MLNATLLLQLSQYSTGTSKDMLKNLYVDNVVTGCNSKEAAYYSTARAIMNDANFNLRNWASNSNILMEQTRKDGTAADSINVLGLQWDTVSDTMSLIMKSPIPTLVTKREVLHEASKVFNSIGVYLP